MRNNRNNIATPSFKRMVDEFFNTSLGDILDYKEHNQPKANIRADKNAYFIEMIVPGYSKSDINLELESGKLKVSSVLKEKQVDEQIKYFIKEFKVLPFSRTFQLPERILEDKIDAQYKKGILTIAIPKNLTEEEQHKKNIEIK